MLIQADARSIPLKDKSVQCCVTSPPYWGLRDYGVGGQIGLESTPEEYVATMVAVFREVKRVLRDDGTCWLNLGDSYSGSGKGGQSEEKRSANWQPIYIERRKPANGAKPKDLIGIPWRVAFALQADGWTLRSDIVWNKPNPMPESVSDRPTRSHEYIFMFSKAKWVGPPRRQYADISDSDARWLAMFLDTEGNITVKRSTQASGKTTYGIQLGFANSHRGLLEQAQRIIGRGTILDRPGRNAPMYYLQVSNIQAADLLHRIYPFFIVKQRQARLGIYLQEILADSQQERHAKNGLHARQRYRSDDYTAKLELLWATNKALNHFGNPNIDWIPEPTFGRWDSQPYFYDADAIREDGKDWSTGGPGTGILETHHYHPKNGGNAGLKAIAARYKTGEQSSKRNKRSVWTVNSEPTPEAHFATFPQKLIEPCILAGTSEKGCCAQCGAPRVRMLGEATGGAIGKAWLDHSGDAEKGNFKTASSKGYQPAPTTGWRASCAHDAPSVPCVVLDPFIGSGTTGKVCERLGRRWVGIELSPAYLTIASKRTAQIGLGI